MPKNYFVNVVFYISVVILELVTGGLSSNLRLLYSGVKGLDSMESDVFFCYLILIDLVKFFSNPLRKVCSRCTALSSSFLVQVILFGLRNPLELT